ncbi:hypothetical protein ABZ714_31100 [Streptomyces sp. NPDC006798]|uniref:hypothetical protein n=1 Tax=Streptomyces sp. NPDC006798 TaxID=3155462 RepID=UPI00340B2AAA
MTCAVPGTRAGNEPADREGTRTMGWTKAKLKQVMGRKKEADGIALRDDRLRAEGERQKRSGREEEAALRRAARESARRRAEGR